MLPRGEVIVVASSFMQARVIFDHCLGFMADTLADQKAWRTWDTSSLARIQNRQTGASIRCIGSPIRAERMDWRRLSCWPMSQRNGLRAQATGCYRH